MPVLQQHLETGQVMEEKWAGRREKDCCRPDPSWLMGIRRMSRLWGSGIQCSTAFLLYLISRCSWPLPTTINSCNKKDVSCLVMLDCLVTLVLPLGKDVKRKPNFIPSVLSQTSYHPMAIPQKEVIEKRHVFMRNNQHQTIEFCPDYWIGDNCLHVLNLGWEA